MKNATAIIVILICGATLKSHATEGFAISAHGADACQLYSNAGDIIRYEIKADKVVSQKIIYQGCGRLPRINKKGTHVAFYQGANCAKGSCSQWTLMLMKVDGTDQKTLMTLPSGSSGGRLAWSADNWIYYFEGTTLKRIKPDNPSLIETVVTFSTGNAGWWEMDAFGKRMSYHSTVHVRYALPGSGQIDVSPSGPDYVGTGCNNIISPSGNTLCWTVDAGHSVLITRAWDSGAKWDTLYTWEQYNTWATDKSMETICTGTTVPVTVGNGFEGNRWSANSDKWVCLGLGWPPNGRFAACGKNQVLVNWQDQKTIMVSYNPRAQCKSGPELCTKHSSETRLYNDAGDFWVTSPESDIIPELRMSTTVRMPRPNGSGPRGESTSGDLCPIYDMRGRKIASSPLSSIRTVSARGVFLVAQPKGREFHSLFIPLK